MAAEDVAIGSAAAASTWSVLSSAAHLPPSALVSGAAALGVVSTWQAVQAKLENRRKSKKPKEGNDS